jgi:hypothetical protein
MRTSKYDDAVRVKPPCDPHAPPTVQLRLTATG